MPSAKLSLAGTAFLVILAAACAGAATPTPTSPPPTPTPTATASPAPDQDSGDAGTSFTWNVQDVDRGVKPALALHSGGAPHVAYMLEALQGFVKAAVLDGPSWEIATLAEGYFYGPLDIAIGPDDVVHVSFHNHQDTQFRPEKGDAAYAVLRGSEWEVQDISDQGHDGWDNRLVVDAQGRPHISTIDPEEFGGNGVEYYTIGADGQWLVEEVGSGPLTYKFATSIGVDPQGNPHITYYDQTSDDLKLASRSASGWSIATVDAQGETGLFSSLVIDGTGRFHISYLHKTGQSSGVVKYATRGASDSNWQLSEVGTLENLVFGFIGARNVTSLALDSQGNPWIAYSDEKSMKLAIWDGSAWQTQTVVDAGARPLGQQVSLKLDSQDEPHIAYYEVTNKSPLDGVVMYAQGSRGG